MFGSFDGNLYILNIQSGKIFYKYRTNSAIYSTPVIHDNTVYFSSLDKYLYALDLETLKLKWSFQTQGKLFASPKIIDGSVYIGSSDGKLYEIDVLTGKELGSMQVTERITNEIVYNTKTHNFFLLTFANEIYCLRRK